MTASPWRKIEAFVSLEYLIFLLYHRCCYPKLLANLSFNNLSNFDVLFEIVFGILTPLADALAVERIPRAGLFDHSILGTDIYQFSFFRHATAIDDIKLCFTKRGSNFILDDFHLRATADHFFALFYRTRTTNIESHGGV